MLRRDLLRVSIVMILAAQIPVAPSTGEAQINKPQGGITVFFVQPGALRTAELRARFTDLDPVRKTVLVYSSDDFQGVGALVETEFDGREWSADTGRAAEKLGSDGHQQSSSPPPPRYNRLAAVIGNIARYVTRYQKNNREFKNSRDPILPVDIVFLLKDPLHSIADELIRDPFCRDSNSDRRFSRVLAEATAAFDGLFETARQIGTILKLRFRFGLVDPATDNWMNTEIYNLLRAIGFEAQKSRGIEMALFNTTCRAVGANLGGTATRPGGGEIKLEGQIEAIARDCPGDGGRSPLGRFGQGGKQIPIPVPECGAPPEAMDLTNGTRRLLVAAVDPSSMPDPIDPPAAAGPHAPVAPPQARPAPPPGQGPARPARRPPASDPDSTSTAALSPSEPPTPGSTEPGSPTPGSSPTASDARLSSSPRAKPGLSIRIASARPMVPSSSRAKVDARARTAQHGRVVLVRKPPGTGQPTDDEVRRAKESVLIDANARLRPGTHRLFLVIEPDRVACDSGRPFRVDVEMEGRAFEPGTARRLTITEVFRSCETVTVWIASFSGK